MLCPVIQSEAKNPVFMVHLAVFKMDSSLSNYITLFFKIASITGQYRLKCALLLRFLQIACVFNRTLLIFHIDFHINIITDYQEIKRRRYETIFYSFDFVYGIAYRLY